MQGPRSSLSQVEEDVANDTQRNSAQSHHAFYQRHRRTFEVPTQQMGSLLTSVSDNTFSSADSIVRELQSQSVGSAPETHSFVEDCSSIDSGCQSDGTTSSPSDPVEILLKSGNDEQLEKCIRRCDLTAPIATYLDILNATAKTWMRTNGKWMNYQIFEARTDTNINDMADDILGYSRIFYVLFSA